jgi:hypothetical protein
MRSSCRRQLPRSPLEGLILDELNLNGPEDPGSISSRSPAASRAQGDKCNAPARYRRKLTLSALAVVGAAVAGAFIAFLLDQPWSGRNHPSRDAAVWVERIIQAESGGSARAKNTRSSATGAGQFLDETWLELVRKHRPDLKGLDNTDVLQLRYDPTLARAMTLHLVERNAAILRNKGVPITAATLYLAHFAGGAGAAAILSAPPNADAAETMAAADASRRTSPEKIVKANPFLAGLSTGALKRWAELKMQIR